MSRDVTMAAPQQAEEVEMVEPKVVRQLRELSAFPLLRPAVLFATIAQVPAIALGFLKIYQVSLRGLASIGWTCSPPTNAANFIHGSSICIAGSTILLRLLRELR